MMDTKPDVRGRVSKGFTLLEVVMGLVILAVGMLAVAGMQVTSIKGNFSSGNVTRATILAQSKLEDLRRVSYTPYYTDASLTSGQHNEGTLSGSIFSRVYDVGDISSTMKAITVTVQWTDLTNHSISLSTIRSQE